MTVPARSQVLGCIADDVTGGTDVAAALRRAGLAVALHIGVPSQAPSEAVVGVDAVVVALKSRTAEVDVAVAESLASLEWLLAAGADRVYVKYCSTFDSTPSGNIGPVVDAVVDRLGQRQAVVCPASPEHARTVYAGHLFVGSELLSESSMRHHPLTPMTDARLVRVLAPQTPHAVGLVDHAILAQGPEAVARAVARLRDEGVRHVVTDAVDESDLDRVVDGCRDVQVLSGGAGLAGAWARWRAAGSTGTEEAAELRTDLPSGRAVVVAGSCSSATTEQVARAREVMPSHRLDPERTPDPEDMLREAQEWLARHHDSSRVLVYSTAGPDERQRARAAMGEQTSAHLEATLARLAADAVEAGAVRVVVAGGETSGAVVHQLAVEEVMVAAEADRGVPWCLPTDRPGLALLLKSGNFGGPDLLVRASEEVLA